MILLFVNSHNVLLFWDLIHHILSSSAAVHSDAPLPVEGFWKTFADTEYYLADPSYEMFLIHIDTSRRNKLSEFWQPQPARLLSVL